MVWNATCKDRWVAVILLTVCSAVILVDVSLKGRDLVGMSRKPLAENWHEARLGIEAPCWLLLRHVPPSGEAGVWVGIPESNVQSLQLAMRLSYLCAPRKLAPFSVADAHWPHFMLVIKMEEEDFLEAVAKQHVAEQSGGWYPVETMQTESGEYTLYGDATTDTGSAALAARPYDDVATEMQTIMHPHFQLWPDGVWPFILVIAAWMTGYGVIHAFFSSALAGFSSVSRIAYKFNVGMNLLALAGMIGLLLWGSLIAGAAAALVFGIVVRLCCKPVFQIQDVSRKPPAQNHFFNVGWAMLAILVSYHVLLKIWDSPLNDPPGMGVWCWRAKAMIVQGSYPFGALAQQPWGGIHQPDYPFLYPSMLALLSTKGGAVMLDGWSKFLPFLGWLGMLAMVSGFPSASRAQMALKAAGLVLLAGGVAGVNVAVATSDEWLWFTLSCTLGFLLPKSGGNGVRSIMLAAFLMVAMCWCKREGMLISVIVAFACVCFEWLAQTPSARSFFRLKSKLLLIVAILAPAFWLVLCKWQGLASADLHGLGASLLPMQNWESIRSGWISAGWKMIIEPGFWALLASILTIFCVRRRPLISSRAGVIFLAASVCALVFPCIFIFSNLHPTMTAWQIEVTLPRLWFISQLMVLLSVPALLNESEGGENA